MENIILRDYQINIINTTIRYFIDNDKAILNMCCRSGKTITSLSIAKEMKVRKLLILVPSIILVEQWIDVIELIFPDKTILKYKKKIKYFDILISTYHNSKLIKESNYDFDLIIFDECHHLTGYLDNINDINKSFLHALEIKTIKQIGLTATLKKLKSKKENIIDNYSIKYFGDIIINYNTQWAIKNNIITDFNIQLLIINDNILKYDNIIKNNKLYFSAYIALYNLYNKISKNILIYANKIKHIDEIILYINYMLNNNVFNLSKINIYKCTSDNYFDLSNLTKTNNILCSVYSLGEGYDLPFLDTVIFSENMTSDIRIIQSMLRPCRQYESKINALIILPIICNKYIAYNDEFKKIKLIIKAISNNNDSIKDYYLSKVTCHELINQSNLDKHIFINHNILTINKYIDNIIMSKNNFNILNEENKIQKFLSNNFTFAKNIEFIHNNKNFDKKQLSSFGILVYLYNIINDSKLILKSTTLSKGILNNGKHLDHKVKYLDHLNLFLRGIDNNTAIKEIVNIIIKFDLQVKLIVQLKKNKEIVEFTN